MELNAYLQEVTDRVVKQVLHEDSSDVTIVDQPLLITNANGSEDSSVQPTNFETTQSQKAPKGHHSNKNKKKKKRKKKKRKH